MRPQAQVWAFLFQETECRVRGCWSAWMWQEFQLTLWLTGKTALSPNLWQEMYCLRWSTKAGWSKRQMHIIKPCIRLFRKKLNYTILQRLQSQNNLVSHIWVLSPRISVWGSDQSFPDRKEKFTCVLFCWCKSPLMTPHPYSEHFVHTGCHNHSWIILWAD